MRARDTVLNHLKAGGTGTVGVIAKAVCHSPQAVFKIVNDLERMGQARHVVQLLDPQGTGFPRECRVWSWTGVVRSVPSAHIAPNLTVVQRALASRPALATVWGRAQA